MAVVYCTCSYFVCVCVCVLGISEMYKTPVIERKRRSAIDSSAMKTPVGGLGTSVVEPSVLNTPEEPGKVLLQSTCFAGTEGFEKLNPTGNY